MQATMTVRTDAQVKAEFTKICEDLGMSANTAFNVFMRAVMDAQGFPFTLGRKHDVRQRAIAAFEAARREAEQSTTAELTREEIDAEIAACRAERKAKQERPHA